MSGDVFVAGFGRRLKAARLMLDSRAAKPVGNAELGRRVGEALGRGPIDQSAVGRWGKTAVPDVRTLAVLAAICGVDPGWLGFGEASAAPAPATWALVATSGAPESPESIAERILQAGADLAAHKRKRRPARRRSGGG